MIDLHCHALPGIDDGPARIEDALSLAEAAAAAGIETILATPHVSFEFRNDQETIRRLTAELNDRLAEQSIPVRVLPGAEVAATWAADADPDQLEALTLGGSRSLLLEPPFSPVITGFQQLAELLIARGQRIVIAHPERCPAFHRDIGMLRQLVDAGALTSLTARSLTSGFGAPARRLALRLLEEGLAHNVASDAHDDLARPPRIAGELSSAGVDESLALWLTELVPAAILADDPIPPRPAGRPAGGTKGVLARLLRR